MLPSKNQTANVPVLNNKKIIAKRFKKSDNQSLMIKSQTTEKQHKKTKDKVC